MTDIASQTDPVSFGSNPSASSKLGALTIALCGIAALIGLLDLIGWWFHQSMLVGIFPEAATMKPNTAVCVLLLSVAAFLLRTSSRGAPVGRVLAVCAAVLGAATLLEYWTGHSFGIDQLLASVPPEQAGDPIGRMSQGTAVDALLCGLALGLIDTVPTASVVLAAVGTLLSVSALVGYLFDASPLLGFPLLRSMAVRTAFSFAVIQLACFLMRPQRDPVRSLLYSARHHRMGGWFVIGTCVLPLLLGLPVALLYRHRVFTATFAFALLVVFLMGAQAILVARNSRSLAHVESRRRALERARELLEQQNRQQYEAMKLSERHAAASEAQYRLITDGLPSLVSYVDQHLRYARVNRTYETWFGLPASEIEGKTIDEVLGVAADAVRAPLTAALAGAPQQFESRFKTLQGDRTVSISHTPDIDRDGRVHGVIVQVLDVTGRRREEAALRQTEKLAAVGKLASSIAHEINNPLESVTNLLYLARHSTDLRQVQEYLCIAEEELGRVSAIASQTLRFHKQSTRPTPVHATELLNTVLAIYRPRLAHRIRVKERHRHTEPILCLDGEIRQVLNNLVGNAIDAMQLSGGDLTLRTQSITHWRTGQKGVTFAVFDSGPGMSAATAESIFEAFFTTKGMSGTGLGLWVSKEIVDRHHGSIAVRSSQRQGRHGTVFRVFLPYFATPVLPATGEPEAAEHLATSKSAAP